MKIKRVLIILLTLLMVVTTGCASGGPSDSQSAALDSSQDGSSASQRADGEALSFPTDKKWKIGFAAREIVNDFNRDIIDGAKTVIEAAGGEMIVVDAGADVGKHNENIENLINSGVDGIIVMLGDQQQLAPLIEKANAANIPVITTAVMAQVPGSICDVSGDEMLCSTLASRMLLSSMDYQGDLYVFWVPGATLLEQRKRALDALLVDFPQVNVIEVPTEHNPAKVQSQMEDILTANPDAGSIGGVWVAYDQLGTGAYQAIMQAGRSEIRMASMDGDKIAFQMMYAENSPFVACGGENIRLMGTIAGESMVKVANGRADEIDGAMYTSAYAITRHNGIEAAKVRFDEATIWDELGLEQEEIIKKYPQTDELYMVRPLAP